MEFPEEHPFLPFLLQICTMSLKGLSNSVGILHQSKPPSIVVLPTSKVYVKIVFKQERIIMEKD